MAVTSKAPAHYPARSAVFPAAAGTRTEPAGRETRLSMAEFCRKWGVEARALRGRSKIWFFEASEDHPAFFLKLYGASWGRGWLRSSKVKREAANLEILRSLGMKVPKVIFQGSEFHLLGLRRGHEVIATEAVAGAEPLHVYLPKLKRGDARRRRLIVELATLVRRMHDANFYHRDLKWRNLLVAPDAAGEPVLWWIDCPSGSRLFWRWRRRHARIKDLATLARPGRVHCSPREQMLFIRTYLGESSKEARHGLGRSIVRYMTRRWVD